MHDFGSAFGVDEVRGHHDRTHTLAAVEAGHAWREIPRSPLKPAALRGHRSYGCLPRLSKRASIIARVTDVDAHVVAFTRQALGFVAETGLAHLARNVAERDAELLAR